MAEESDKEHRRQEIRERIQTEINAKAKQKKGFMTPERKKRLRVLLRRKAADQVKRQLEMKELERNRVITERTGERAPIEEITDEERLIEICKELHNRIYALNEDKWELELSTALKEHEINELQYRVNDMRGKFIIPPLKKVSKLQNQIEKMKQWTAKLAKLDMREGLRSVKKEVDLGDKKGKDHPQAEFFQILQKTPTSGAVGEKSGNKTSPNSPTSTKAPAQIGDPIPADANPKEQEEEEEEEEEEEVGEESAVAVEA